MCSDFHYFALSFYDTIKIAKNILDLHGKICGGFFMPKIKEVLECPGNLKAPAAILAVPILLMIGTVRNTRA